MKASTGLTGVLPPGRERYLAEIATTVRDYHRHTAEQAEVARRRQHLQTALTFVQGDAAAQLERW